MGLRAVGPRPAPDAAQPPRRTSSGHHHADYYRRLVTGLDMPCAPDEAPRIAARSASVERARALLEHHRRRSSAPLVGFAPGAAYGQAKQWPPERMAAVAARLVRERGATCVVVWGVARSRRGACDRILVSRARARRLRACGESHRADQSGSAGRPPRADVGVRVQRLGRHAPGRGARVSGRGRVRADRRTRHTTDRKPCRDHRPRLLPSLSAPRLSHRSSLHEAGVGGHGLPGAGRWSRLRIGTPLMTPAVFLDRDGTMIHDVGYLRRVEDVRWFASTIDAIRLLNRAGFLRVRDDQSERDRARPLHGRRTWRRFTRGWRSTSKPQAPVSTGGSTARIIRRPRWSRYRVVCECRKPRAGMIRQAAEQFPIDLARSFVIGDKLLDLGLADRGWRARHSRAHGLWRRRSSASTAGWCQARHTSLPISWRQRRGFSARAAIRGTGDDEGAGADASRARAVSARAGRRGRRSGRRRVHLRADRARLARSARA